MTNYQTPEYKEILDSMHDGVYFVDRRRRITYWNGGAERITGYLAKDVTGHSCADNILNHVDGEGNLLCQGMCPLAHTIRDGQFREADVFLHHANGHRVPVTVRVSPLRNANGEIVGAVETFSENIEKMSALSRLQELEEVAFLDSLTGIGNRRFIETQLKRMMQEYAEHDWSFSVLFVDIDHFKKVNDTWGHDVGDEVLKMVASTLHNNLRGFDIVGRWGGEEFIVLLPNVTATVMKQVANRLRILVENSRYDGEEGKVKVTISLGAASIRPGETIDQLVKRADGALYTSKKNGRNRLTIG